MSSKVRRPVCRGVLNHILFGICGVQPWKGIVNTWVRLLCLPGLSDGQICLRAVSAADVEYRLKMSTSFSVSATYVLS